MDNLQKARLRRLNIRLSEPEWEKVHRHSSSTTCRSISEYARKVLLDKPVKVFYRSQSPDNFEALMLALLAQLDAFSDHYEQLVKKIDTLKNIQELKEILNLLLICLDGFTRTANEIRTHMEEIAGYAIHTSSGPASSPQIGPIPGTGAGVIAQT